MGGGSSFEQAKLELKVWRDGPMLIRWATENDLPAWYTLATEVSPIFRHPADMGKDPEFISYTKSKASKYEALTAIDYMSGKNMGFIGFSRTHNRITWLGVSDKYRGRGVGSRLLKTALRHLDHTKPITVETYPEGYAPGVPAKNLYRKYGFVETESNLFGPHDLPICRMTADLSVEKRGGSFHYRYPEFIKAADKAFCPVCNAKPAPDGQTDIEINDKVWICGEYPGQGRLFGKMYVMPRKHYFHFEDMPSDEMVDFMSEVQRVGTALRKVTGAVKINYEMHANSGAHLHIHLFPRYLDDDFPSAPIDYRITEPAPYESHEEYLWFVEQMRKELQLTRNIPYYLAYEKR
jgi:diadenosine tetraphosphate (Ap4A) HIT family hydrolase/ribosomal protein S18 acetylase RimI-like enzyme